MHEIGNVVIIWVMREIGNYAGKLFFTNKCLDFTNDIKCPICCHLMVLTMCNFTGMRLLFGFTELSFS